MLPRGRGPEPDPRSARDHIEFRDALRALLRWAGHSSLQQLEAAAARRGTSMPVSTSNRALNTDRLPTGEFVRRFVLASGGDVARWTEARETLADQRYARDSAEARPGVGQADDRASTSDICPYPGLASFGRGEAQWFFGRECVTAELLELLAARTNGAGPLVVVGPSGTGKSSLLGAGLLAALDEGRLPESAGLVQVLLTPTATPLRELAAHLGPTSDQAQDLEASLREDPTRAIELLPGARPVALIVVDQFEEVFTLCSDEGDRQAFVRALCAISTSLGGPPPALVILGLRADFYDRCADYRELIQALRHGQVLLGAMDEAELRAAIERPAETVGLELEPGLVDLLVHDLGGGRHRPGYQPGALPLLAHALRATWQQRDSRLLTVDGYRLVGGITGSVARTAERAFQQLDAVRQEIARSVLLRMIQLGEGIGDVRRQVNQTRLITESSEPQAVASILDVLIQARLLTTDGSKVEIVHEALLSAWPRLREWIEADRAGLLVEQRLIAAAEAWAVEGRHDADLYRGPRLASAQERMEGAGRSLPAIAREFIAASAARAQEDERDALRRTQRLRTLVGVLACLLVLAGASTIVAVEQQGDLRAQRAVDLSREVANAANVLRNSDSAAAAQLAVAAYRIWPTAEARGVVLSSLITVQGWRRSNSDTAGEVRDVAFSADGSLLASADTQRTVRVWKGGTQANLEDVPLAELRHPDQVRGVAFDPRNRFLATFNYNREVRLYKIEDLATAAPVPWVVLPAWDLPLVFSPDGSILATGTEAKNGVRLWDLAGPRPEQRGELLGHRLQITAAAFDREGVTLATSSLDGTIKLWDVRDRNAPLLQKPIEPGVDSFVYSVAFHPDGRVLASAHGDKSAKLWDVGDRTNPLLLETLVGHRAPVADVTFSPDGKLLATVSHDQAGQLWNVTNPFKPTLHAAPLEGDFDNMYATAFAFDSHTLATASHDKTIRLWETDTDQAVALICGMGLPALTPDVWTTHVPDRPMEQPCPGARPAQPAPEQPPPPLGSTELVAEHSGACVAIRGFVATPEVASYQMDCDGAPGTQWLLRQVGGAQPASGPYQLVSVASGMCLESSDADRLVGQASRATQRPCRGEDAIGQIWTFEMHTATEKKAKGMFKNKRSHDCLDVNHGAISSGTPVIRWQCAGGSNQLFEVSLEALAK